MAMAGRTQGTGATGGVAVLAMAPLGTLAVPAGGGVALGPLRGVGGGERVWGRGGEGAGAPADGALVARDGFGAERGAVVAGEYGETVEIIATAHTDGLLKVVGEAVPCAAPVGAYPVPVRPGRDGADTSRLKRGSGPSGVVDGELVLGESTRQMAAAGPAATWRTGMNTVREQRSPHRSRPRSPLVTATVDPVTTAG
ncbi:hypothetical protein [Streptomyces albipurpureus]|uniref:Uncharacterized protein n=1 Tax=Streptomyces albipurpureus TaxID=2897419 RepID=A0ABT0UP74_9ACTN|nr:hypothetical protein [Streptomyces sp. CWNU-1]MCM2389051.1 hypothetical protein [Streptomyces sp. CWNU-1]